MLGYRNLSRFAYAAAATSLWCGGIAQAAPNTPPGTAVSNTATAVYAGDRRNDSNTLIFNVEPTPSTLSFHIAEKSDNRFVNSVTPSNVENKADVELTECAAGSTGENFSPSPPPKDFRGEAIDISAGVPILVTSTFRANDTLFVRLTDLDQNLDDALRETAEVLITNNLGDFERLRLHEKGLDSGVFEGYIQTTKSGAIVNYNCILTVEQETLVIGEYTDPRSGDTDRAESDAKVDPFGMVFSSRDGEAVDGAVVRLVVSATGADAVVYGDDGVSAFPATVISGATVTDSSGQQYTFPPGGYRFPFVDADDYRLEVTPPGGFSGPSQQTVNDLQNLPNAPFALLEPGSFGGEFSVQPGPPLHVDYPVDPVVDSELVLDKIASRTLVSQGEFVQYKLTLENRNLATAEDLRLIDYLPHAFRYELRSLKINGEHAGEPENGGRGPTLSIPLPDLAGGETMTISYVLNITAATPIGEAINRAHVESNIGVSNTALALVKVKPAFLDEQGIVIGQITAGACEAKDRSPVANVRLLMEDGRYVVSDEEGRYHFEGITPGTHVIQLDEASLPAGWKPTLCDNDTRAAGRAFSRFVDLAGGSLWRVDFILEPVGPVRAAPVTSGPDLRVGLISERDGEQIHHQIHMTGGRPVNNLRVMLMANGEPLLAPDSLIINGVPAGDDLDDGVLTLRLGDRMAAPWDEVVNMSLDAGIDTHNFKLIAMFATAEESNLRTPVAEVSLADGALKAQAEVQAEIPSVDLDAKANNPLLIDNVQKMLADGKTEVQWSFPPEQYNPAIPAVHILIRHGDQQKVKLAINGAPVSPLHYEGRRKNRNAKTGASLWRGIRIEPGKNVLTAEVLDTDGNVVETLSREVYYSRTLAFAKLAKEASSLTADGLSNPIVAVRLTDPNGRPMPRGLTGVYRVLPPHQAQDQIDLQERRVLAGTERFDTKYVIDNDDGLAKIELVPTSETGEVHIEFDLPEKRVETVRAWLEPAAQEWVVVGFAEGTAGHERITSNLQTAQADGHRAGDYTDGQLKLFAKGTIKGEWLATLAYDSEKTREVLNQRLAGLFDPDEFYTVYGDQSQQQFGAASQDKLYLRIERKQFYAMYGDYSASLEGELTGYGRGLNGFITEYNGERYEMTAFASETEQEFSRDEIRGDGTSGPYKLLFDDVVINSERVTIETRDRLRSEEIIETKSLRRHVDYEIDYFEGTLLFKAPVLSQDFDLNPTFIIVEYESDSGGPKNLTAGGRAAVKFMDGDLELAISGVREETQRGAGVLYGANLTWEIMQGTEIILEGAFSDNRDGNQQNSAAAVIARLVHVGENTDGEVYYRRQEGGFGLGQTNGSEDATQKFGGRIRIRVNDGMETSFEAYRQQNLGTGSIRDVITSELRHNRESGHESIGVQYAGDVDGAGLTRKSQQVTASIGQRFFNNKLEFEARGEYDLGSDDTAGDFPNRFGAQLGWRVTDYARIVLAQEYTFAETRDTESTRFGVELNGSPWDGANAYGTLTQSLDESGPRNFATAGLQQSLLLGERWSVDFSVDRSQTVGQEFSVFNRNQTAAQGSSSGDDSTALSTGATWRGDDWSWASRLESRHSNRSDRYGIITGLLRESQTGKAFSARMEYFIENGTGVGNDDLDLRLALAHRPVGVSWMFLNRLDLKYQNQTGGSFGSVRSRRVVNNFSVNWSPAANDEQLSIYLGGKYVLDNLDGQQFDTVALAAVSEYRFDLGQRFDLGLRAGVRTTLDRALTDYNFGPSVGFTPMTNLWLTFGYNIEGFSDQDFGSAGYTAQGVYFRFRLRFDQYSFKLRRDFDALAAGNRRNDGGV